MEQFKDAILIIGSAPGARLPKHFFKEIYSSNASAELGRNYQNTYPESKHTCTIGSRSFLKIKEIKEKVINSTPDNLIIRDKDSNVKDIEAFFSYKTEVVIYNKVKQFYFQKNFFRKGIVDLIIAEYNYYPNFKEKIKHFHRAILEKGFLGVSSGFFNILLAAYKHPNSKIIITGLSFEGGEHYYKSGSMSKNRGYVDRYLIERLNLNIASRLIFTEKKYQQDML